MEENDTDGDQWKVFVISSEDLERDEPILGANCGGLVKGAKILLSNGNRN